MSYITLLYKSQSVRETLGMIGLSVGSSIFGLADAVIYSITGLGIGLELLGDTGLEHPKEYFNLVKNQWAKPSVWSKSKVVGTMVMPAIWSWTLIRDISGFISSFKELPPVKKNGMKKLMKSSPMTFFSSFLNGFGLYRLQKQSHRPIFRSFRKLLLWRSALRLRSLLRTGKLWSDVLA